MSNSGDTAFVLMCTAMVCLMTPALALGGFSLLFGLDSGSRLRARFGYQQKRKFEALTGRRLTTWRGDTARTLRQTAILHPVTGRIRPLVVRSPLEAHHYMPDDSHELQQTRLFVCAGGEC